MDSVTQIALGAAVGGLVAHKQLGWRAYLIGAGLGTLPDLDVLIQYDNAVDNVTRHRGFSHSLFVLTAITPILAWLCQRWAKWRQHSLSWPRTMLLIWLGLITHPLLDSFTSYGTQLWWPLAPPPTSWSSIFIIDPLYTLPLLIGAIVAMSRRKRHSPVRGYGSNLIGFIIASSYLAAGFGLSKYVQQKAAAAMTAQHIEGRIFVSPTPFNIALWRIVAVDNNYWYSAYVSVFDDDKTLSLSRQQPLHHDQGAQMADVQRLAWFTHGFYQVDAIDNQLVVTDLRLGVEPVMPFRFVVAERPSEQQEWQPVRSEQLTTQRPRRDQLSWVWLRMRSQTQLSPHEFIQQQGAEFTE
ncbi:metal-dependent hydrolase [Neiella sp. HB171785]|uniref:Metal-dependent hydrolase n=1 Tax=Neiella litorisoli TaxID=2771431 RepID=A0A8J6QEU9_9GAMM|nr:metal-dependent hydrolase [Neiella litorisoli]MBD1387830.1 metal-dependent hydrolase [Neiella litorisoli]